MSKPKGLNSGPAMQGLEAWLPTEEDTYNFWFGDGAYAWDHYLNKCKEVCAKRNPRPTGFEKYYKLPRKF